MASNAATIGFSTLIEGAVSEFEVYSAYLREQTWTRQAVMATDKPPTMMEMLVMMGLVNKNGTTNLVTWHTLEAGRYKNAFNVNAAAQPAIGAQITLTVSADSYDATGGSIIYDGMEVRFPDGTIGIIPAGGVTRAPFNDTFDLDLHQTPQFPAVAQGTTLISLGTSVGEAAAANPQFIHTDVRAYDHNTRVFDYSTSFTDFYMAYDNNGKVDSTVSGLPAPWVNGTVSTWGSHAFKVKYDASMVEVNTALLLDQRKTQGGPATLADARYLTGLVPWIQAGGQNFITPSGNMTIAALDLIAEAYINAAHGEVSHRIMAGRDLWNKFNNLLISLPGQDTRQGQGNDNYKYDYKSLSGLGGHDFSFSMVDDFTNPQTGLVKQGFGSVGLFIPNKTEIDTLTKETVPCMQLKWQAPFKALNNGSGNGMWSWSMQSGHSFAAGGQRTSNTDRIIPEWKCTIGLQLLQPSRFGIMQ